jgi:secreted trypsin-like serine protease
VEKSNNIQEAEQAIVGGKAAEQGEIEWQAGLFLSIPGSTEPVHFCGGTLVDAKRGWVVTAAHCVTISAEDDSGRFRQMPPEPLRVAVGKVRLSTLKPEDYLRVAQVLVHPNYNDLTTENDIALLQVQGVAPDAATARLAGTNPRDLSIGPGRMAIVSGWGSLEAVDPEVDAVDPGDASVDADAGAGTQAHMLAAESGDSAALQDDVDAYGYPDTLRWTVVPLAPQALCRKVDGDPSDPSIVISDTMLCAGRLRGGRDTCDGDSGGPLVVPQPFDKPVLVGVTSWGPGCAWPGTYGVYTRVSSFAPWLTACMDEPQTCAFPSEVNAQE